MGRRIEKSLLPRDLETALTEADFDLVFTYLEKTFHLNKNWRADFRTELLKTTREQNSVNFFVYYLTKNIEPALRQILRRNDRTIIAILRYIMKQKIEAKISLPKLTLIKGEKNNNN